jgi:hypothetical protein
VDDDRTGGASDEKGGGLAAAFNPSLLALIGAIITRILVRRYPTRAFDSKRSALVESPAAQLRPDEVARRKHGRKHRGQREPMGDPDPGFHDPHHPELPIPDHGVGRRPAGETLALSHAEIGILVGLYLTPGFVPVIPAGLLGAG